MLWDLTEKEAEVAAATILAGVRNSRSERALTVQYCAKIYKNKRATLMKMLMMMMMVAHTYTSFA